jgi:PhnB protein
VSHLEAINQPFSGDVMRVEAYLNFDGRCEEAVEFYKKALGAEVVMMLRFKDNPEPAGAGQCAPGADNKVMHVSMRIGESTVMASDCHCEGKADFRGVSLSLTMANEGQVERAFGELAEGGKVGVPLTKTFFSPRFGVVTDRFGVTWMILVGQ